MALKEQVTLAELAQIHDVYTNQITYWKTQLLEWVVLVFDGGAKHAEQPDLKNLHAKIGELTL